MDGLPHSAQRGERERERRVEERGRREEQRREAVRMEAVKIAVVAAIGIFGLLSAILGLAAEFTRHREGEIFYTCDEVRNPTTGLGIGGAVILVLTMVFANVCGGCVCCCTYGRNLDSSKKMPTVACFAMSWVVFTISFFLMLIGGITNGAEGTSSDGYVTCTFVRAGIVGGGGGLALVCTGLAISYYLLATSASLVVSGTPVQPANTHTIAMQNATLGPSHEKVEFQTGPQVGPYA